MSNLKIGKDSTIDKLINQTEITILKFGATWCGPCKMLAPILEKLADEMADITFIDIDVDDDEASTIVDEANISSVPLIVIFKNGKPVQRILGFRPEEEIIKEIKKVQSTKY